MKFNFKRYLQFLFLASILFIIIGFISGKISTESFTYISLIGSLKAILQILLVVVILMLGLAMTLPALIIDVLLLFIGMSFPLIEAIWYVIWNQVTIGWFWAGSSGSSIFFASLVLAIVSFFGMRRR
ncbi:MAG: hypothetical protein RIC35_04010 [Marinoscillum sp.]